MDITDSVTVSPGENAEFFCVVDANPMDADTIKWTRSGFDMESRDVTLFLFLSIIPCRRSFHKFNQFPVHKVFSSEKAYCPGQGAGQQGGAIRG